MTSLIAKFRTDIDLDKLREEIRQKKEATRKRFSELYPGVSISPLFIFDIQHAEEDEIPCANCKGYPCAKKRNQGFQHVVKVENGNLHFAYCFCEYRKQYMQQKRIEQQFKAARIPIIYRDKTFDDYALTAGNTNAVRMSKFIVDNPETGLYLYGGTGTGKTFLAAIIAQELIKKGKTVIFSDVPTLLDQMKSSFDKDTDSTMSELIETLSSVDMLILDDFGTEFATEWAIERLYIIVNNRYVQGKPIVLTANFKLAQIAERLNRSKNSTGDRIASRLSQVCKIVELSGEDWRRF